MIIREKIELSRSKRRRQERERGRENVTEKERKLQHEAEDGSIIYAKAIFYYSHKKDVDAFLSWIIIVLLYSFSDYVKRIEL